MAPQSKPHPKPTPYTTLRLGLWRVLRANPCSRSFIEIFSDVPSPLLRFFREFYTVSRGMFVVILLFSIWTGLEPILRQNFSTRLVKAVGNVFLRR